MVNVDELNEDIKQFGNVIEKVSQLPDIYTTVQEQLDTSKKNFEELTEIQSGIENFTSQTQENIENNSKDIKRSIEDLRNESSIKISSLEKSVEAKIDKTEIDLRDRIALAESNTTLALNEIKMEMQKNAEDSKKRFIVLTVGIAIVIVIEIVRFFV